MFHPAVPLLSMLGSPLQLLVIILILLLVFGAGRLGDVGKGLGEGIKNFKKGLAGGDDGKSKSRPKEPPAPAPPPGNAEPRSPAADIEESERRG